MEANETLSNNMQMIENLSAEHFNREFVNLSEFCQFVRICQSVNLSESVSLSEFIYRALLALLRRLFYRSLLKF